MKRKAEAIDEDVRTYNSSIHPDLLLCMEGKKFALHSALGMISTWFQALYATETKEVSIDLPIKNATTNEVDEFFTLVYTHWTHESYPIQTPFTLLKNYRLASYFGFTKLLEYLEQEIILYLRTIKYLNCSHNKKTFWKFAEELPRPWTSVLAGVMYEIVLHQSESKDIDAKKFPKKHSTAMANFINGVNRQCTLCLESLVNACHKQPYMVHEDHIKNCCRVFGECGHGFHWHCFCFQSQDVCPTCGKKWIVVAEF